MLPCLPGEVMQKPKTDQPERVSLKVPKGVSVPWSLPPRSTQGNSRNALSGPGLGYTGLQRTGTHGRARTKHRREGVNEKGFAEGLGAQDREELGYSTR